MVGADLDDEGMVAPAPKSRLRRMSSRVVYDSPWLSVREDTVRRRDRIEHFGVINRSDSVVVVPWSDAGSTLLVRQFRYPLQEHSWEFPGGQLLARETPAQGARREFEEETGLVAGRLFEVGSFHPLPGLTRQLTTVFVAEQEDAALQDCASVRNVDDIEGLKYVNKTLLRQMMRSGVITDGVTLASLVLFWRNMSATDMV